MGFLPGVAFFKNIIMPKSIPTRAVLITPSDTVNLPYPNCTIYVGGAGNMKVTTEEGDTVLFSGLAAGDILPVSIAQVWNTTTTATLIIAMW